MTAKRHFYAAYNSYGIRVRFNDYNIPTLHIFDSKRERDEWVDQDWMHRQEITAAEFRKWERVCTGEAWETGNIIAH